jgi:hypothetical protein
MNKRFLFVVLLALAFALPAMADGVPQRDFLYLQNGSDLRISIETYRAKGGWTPVIVSVAGAEVSAVMDEKGRVVHTWAKGLDKHGLALFTIELDKGRILLGRETHAILVYEQNPIRMRFRLTDSVVQLPVRLDAMGKTGELRFGGLEIPAQVNEVGRSSVGRVVNPTGAKLGLVRFGPAGPAAIRSAGPDSAPFSAKGFGAKAQLVPSRLRARAK